jgi:hypothetical protein
MKTLKSGIPGSVAQDKMSVMKSIKETLCDEEFDVWLGETWAKY